ncbi:MAG: hypothetical protein HC890_15820 [Chloroflexaceae bacterium]|nr:hypothetical protein [Chloroflexaceae bacterium]
MSDKAAEEPLPVAETGATAPVTPANPLAARPLQPIPQIAEAKTYFEQRWRPEATLTQALEYRLDVQQDGSIGRIRPRSVRRNSIWIARVCP